MSKDNAAELNQAFAVTRRIPVSAAVDVLAAAAGTLAALPGVHSCRLDGTDRLVLRYDASRLGFPEIERLLDEAGVTRRDSRWWRIKAEWYRFTDGNLRSNASVTPACCSRPPVVPGIKRDE